MTYDEWKDLGFFVRKGEKSHARNEKGQAVFSPEQVDENDVAWGNGWDGDESD